MIGGYDGLELILGDSIIINNRKLVDVKYHRTPSKIYKIGRILRAPYRILKAPGKIIKINKAIPSKTFK